MECTRCGDEPCACPDADVAYWLSSDEASRDYDEWTPPHIPECINPHIIHTRAECYTVEDAEALYEENHDNSTL